MHSNVDEQDVILLIPEMKIRKPSLDRNRFHAFASVSSELAELAKKDWFTALTKNGVLVAKALGIDDTVSKKAVSMGAFAAGMSGTGPALSIIIEKNGGASFLKDLEHDGYDAMITRTR